MTPFAGVMLAFVAMFMAPAMTLIDLPTPGVDLPAVHHPIEQPGALREDAIVIALARDGRVYFGESQVDVRQLPDRLRESLRQGAPRKVYLRADARTKYGNVIELLQAMQATGLQNIGIICEQKKPRLPD